MKFKIKELKIAVPKHDFPPKTITSMEDKLREQIRELEDELYQNKKFTNKLLKEAFFIDNTINEKRIETFISKCNTYEIEIITRFRKYHENKKRSKQYEELTEGFLDF